MLRAVTAVTVMDLSLFSVNLYSVLVKVGLYVQAAFLPNSQ